MSVNLKSDPCALTSTMSRKTNAKETHSDALKSNTFRVGKGNIFIKLMAELNLMLPNSLEGYQVPQQTVFYPAIKLL